MLILWDDIDIMTVGGRDERMGGVENVGLLTRVEFSE